MRKNILESIVLLAFFAIGGYDASAPLSAAVTGTNYNSCYSAGEKAFAVSDFATAAENFAKALQYKPEDLRSRLKYAQALFSLNKYDESLDNLQTVLQISPNNIIARLYLAENFALSGKKESAIEQLKWLLTIQPNHARAKALLAEITEGLSFNATIKEIDAPAVETASDTAEMQDFCGEILYSERMVKAQKAEETEEIDDLKDEAEPNKEVEEKMNAVVFDTHEASVSEEAEKNKPTDSGIVNKSVESMTFTPFVAGKKKKPSAKVIPEKPKMPAAKLDIKNTDMQSFFKAGKDSFVVTLEKVRYEIEKGSLDEAEKSVEIACKIAKAGDNSRNILEAQVLKSLVMLYKCNFAGFGKSIMALKPALSAETYQSFLNIYSRAEELKKEEDKRRLVAGVAVGSGHNRVAVSLLKPVFDKNTGDPIVANMLSEAQLQSYDYKGAGETMRAFANTCSDSFEAQFNMARFYLTADYNPELARKYACLASELAPEDARSGVVLGLVDYSEGRINEGIARIKGLLETVNDNSLKAICQRLIADGEANSGPDAGNKFIRMLALPGSANSDPAMFRFAGDDDLKAGSYFSAMEKYMKADEGVEIGRVYLGLASALTNAGEMELASVAAGYGVKIIKSEMSKGKGLSRASLYLALYGYECGDRESAMAFIDLGFNCRDLDQATYKKLAYLYDALTL